MGPKMGPIAAFYCASQYQIWISEIEYYQKVSSHAQGAEKQLRKVVLGGDGGGWCREQKPIK